MRQLARRMEPTVEWDNDKPTVVALREIAVGRTKDILKQRDQEQLQILIWYCLQTL